MINYVFEVLELVKKEKLGLFHDKRVRIFKSPCISHFKLSSQAIKKFSSQHQNFKILNFISYPKYLTKSYQEASN
jgi:hypothetical protein